MIQQDQKAQGELAIANANSWRRREGGGGYINGEFHPTLEWLLHSIAEDLQEMNKMTRSKQLNICPYSVHDSMYVVSFALVSKVSGRH